MALDDQIEGAGPAGQAGLDERAVRRGRDRAVVSHARVPPDEDSCPPAAFHAGARVHAAEGAIAMT